MGTTSWTLNSASGGTQHDAPAGYRFIPNSGSSVSVTAATQGGQTVSSMTAIIRNITANTNDGSFTFNGGNSTTTTNTVGNGSDWYGGSFNYTNGVAYNIVVTATWTGVAVVPTSISAPGTVYVGQSITLTGQRFDGVTGITFNGTTVTTFTVNSATQITMTVPAGATTGTITVTNPQGSGSSGSVTVAGGHVYRAGVWTAGPAYVYRSGAWVAAQGVFVYRSGVWTPAN